MVSHGARMVESARRQRDDRAAAFRPNRGEAPTDSELVVCLSHSVAGVSKVARWDDMVLEQRELTEEVLTTSKTGDVFALQDRNYVFESWRSIFIVRDKGDFVLFDVKGALIDEQDSPQGRQAATTLVEEFSVDGYFYRPPKVRKSPNDRGARERDKKAEEMAEACSASDERPVSPPPRCGIESNQSSSMTSPQPETIQPEHGATTEVDPK